MKNSRIQISLFVILVASLLFSGCQQKAPAENSSAMGTAIMASSVNLANTLIAQTRTALPSETPTPSITPTPTATLIPTRTAPNLVISRQEILPLTKSSVISKGAPSKPGMYAKVSLPTLPGDYLVYESFDGRSLLYSSLDGKTTGTLMDANFLQERIIEGSTPRFIYAETQLDGIENKQGYFNSEYIWETDVSGNLLNSWKVLPAGSHICWSPDISPYGDWIAIVCDGANDDHDINLINLKTGDTSSFAIHCDLIETAGDFYWSANETKFVYRCPEAEYYFISISIDHVVANQLGDRTNKFDIIGISQDWTHIAINMGIMPQNPDGTISGERLMIANLDCILTNISQCNQGVTFDLPISEPFTPFPDELSPWGGAIYCSWTYDENALMCSTTHGGIGQIDLRTNTIRTIPSGGRTDLLDISPDDQWMILFGKDPNSDNYGLFSMSTHDSSITHFIARPDILGFYSLYGWLTIH